MSLSDIHKLLERAVDELNDDPSDRNSTIQQKFYYANITFCQLTQSYDEELSRNPYDLYSQEATDLYKEINSLLENLEIDESDDPHQPSVVIDEDQAHIIRKKINKLHNLIDAKFKIVDGLDDLYHQ